MTAGLVRVAVPVPLLPSLTYRVPSGQAPPEVGARVRVPLGRRVVIGCVIDTAESPTLAGAGEDGPDVKPRGAAIRDVIEYLDDTPFLPPPVLALALWVSEYYACGPGDAVAAAMPPYAWVRRGRARGRVEAFKTRRYVHLTTDGERVIETAETSALGARQREALTHLADAPDGVAMRVLTERGVPADALRRLRERGLVTFESRRADRDPLPEIVRGGDAPAVELSLTADQQGVCHTLTGLADERRFHVALLHGVTGSGKTEVYVRLARTVCARGQRALILVPEIALAPAVARIFHAAFGARVAIQHSGLSDGERHDQWHRIRRGEVDVVVGTRSAVFAPVDDLGLLVVDEEHDGAYKQEETPRYHARDAAIIRARAAGALVVLGSATPSMESYQNATLGRYRKVVLPSRVLERPLPDIAIVDMREELATHGSEVVLSTQLREGLEARLAAGEQSLVLLNRRGYAAAILCRQCGQSLECPHCSVSLTFHRAAGRVRCHYCNYSQGRPAVCPHCAGPYLERVGFGTERIEAEISRVLPDARVARLDRDSVRRRGVAETLLRRFGRGEIDVMVGTQMIAKGHDFPAVTLVGVISADVGLGLADFRAAERTFQLLTQVAGRAGRGSRRGEAVIQTFYPEHYSIQLACRQSYGPFFDREIHFRRSMRYPPVVAMVNAVIRGPRLGDAMRDATALATELRGRTEFDVLGPAPAPIARVKGEHRVQIFLKGTHRPVMREALQAALHKRPALQRCTTIDVDPLTVL